MPLFQSASALLTGRRNGWDGGSNRWTSNYLFVLHSHGETGAASAHRPRFPARASFSASANSMSAGAYFTKCHAIPWRTITKPTRCRSPVNTSAIVRPHRSLPRGTMETRWPKTRSDSARFEAFPKACFFSGASMPFSLTFIWRPFTMAVSVSPSVTPTTSAGTAPAGSTTGTAEAAGATTGPPGAQEAQSRAQSKATDRITRTDATAPRGRKRGSFVRAPCHRVNARRGLRHREAVHPPEIPKVPLHWPARLNACADFHCLEIESLPGNGCSELLNYCQRFRFRSPNRNKVPRPDGDYLPEFASFPRLTADEQAGVSRILFLGRDAETVACPHGLPDSRQSVRIKRKRPLAASSHSNTTRSLPARAIESKSVVALESVLNMKRREPTPVKALAILMRSVVARTDASSLRPPPARAMDSKSVTDFFMTRRN